MSVWRRLQRIGKKAAKFQFTASLQELCIECSSQYKPGTLLVVWSRRSRRYTSKPIDCQQSEENTNAYNHVWSMPENVEFTTTLYRSEKALQFEEKEWICQIEEVGGATQARFAGPTVRRRVLATRQIELSEFASGIPTQTSLKIQLRLASKKLVSASLLITLHSVILKEGDATDEDMISLASVMSLSRAGSFNVGSGLTINDVGGVGSVSPSFQRFCSTRYPPGYGAKLSASLGGSTFHTDLSKLTAKLQALQHVPDEAETENESEQHETEGTKSNDLSAVQSNVQTNADSFKGDTKPPPTVVPTTSLPNVTESRSLFNRDSKTTAGRSGQDLLAWCQEVTRDCPMVHITDLTTSFQSGLAFCAILHHYYPDKIDMNSLSKNTPVDNCRLAFDVASKLGIPRVLDPVELTLPTRPPDLLSVMTYLHQMRMHCCGPPPAEVSKPVVGILQGNGVIPCSPARRPSMGSEQVLTSRSPRPTSATRRCSTENVGSPTATDAPSELASSNRKSSATMRYEHMLSKARQLLEQTRSQQQQQSLAHLPYTDALPPLASTRKPRPHSTFGMPNCGTIEKVKSSSGPDGSAETRQTPRHSSTKRRKTPRALMRFNSDGTICMPNGTSAATGGSTTSAVATAGPQSPSPRKAVISNSFTSTDGVKVLHLKLSQLNLFASGRGSTAPVPIRIGEHHFSAKTSSSPTVTRNVIRVEPENSDTLHRPNPVDSKPPTNRAVPSTTMAEQPPALSNYIKNEQDELDRAQQELDQEAADLEQRLRHHMKSAPGTAAEEELLRRWFVLVSRKSALIHRGHQLSIMEKEDDLKKKIEMLQEELRRVLSIEEFMKTDSDRRREELLLRDLVNLINERDDMIKELDLHEQALAEDLQHEQRANINAHFVSRDRSDRCVIQ
ncbi:hypothetical protein CRM22_000903 [Opisthorchis felineus]|uniref:EH domain-binding protein 1 n=1 Tax=Opisthorchis felineus TaxID=147828 RepID=A0A4S2MCY9_OPIFE|nr:hypothetical protein CRM22_000903 [Opisthorchis felineus]